ncbi:MAG: trypsin-like serine protease [Elusimicrobiaceae bacterium]|nr:trypsin-like serine protease [Elusimicrobiaceae bacterium]
MKRFCLLAIFTFFLNIGFCQNVSIISSGEPEINTYATTDDFSNTFEINFAPLMQIKPGTKISFTATKCQAVRLSKSWFITAAHCIEEVCQKGCNFQTRLVVGKNYEMDIISQSYPKAPQVFIHPLRDINKNMSTYDIALIHFKPTTSKFVYKDPSTSRGITQQEFMKRLKSYKSYKRALSSYNTPTLLIMGAYRKQGPVYARKFSVLSSFKDERKVLRSNNKAIYYPQTKTFVLENFGIRQGISGSGLMTSKGELAGITSTISDNSLKSISKDGRVKEVAKTQLAQFAALDKSTLEFIQSKVGDIKYNILK